MQSPSSSVKSEIKVRQIKLDFTGVPKHWIGGNPFISHLFHALSFVFPEGERMFVRSVKHYQSFVRNPLLRNEVASFIGQEMYHGNTHEELNGWLARQSPVASRLQKHIGESIKDGSIARQRRVPRIALAETVALEHLTAVLAASLLSRPEIVEKMHPQLRPIAVWHAIEEIEHKSVAFDVYQIAGGGYLMRAVAQIFAVCALTVVAVGITAALLFEDRKSLNWRHFYDFMSLLFGRDGLIAGVIPSFLAGLSPNFHPSQIVDGHLLHQWLPQLASMTSVKQPGKALTAAGL